MAADISTEIWADVPGFPGYQVSTFGNVRSCRHTTRNPRGYGSHIVLRMPWKPLRLNRNRKTGYLTVCLCIDGRKTTPRVAALVLTAHVGPRPPGYQTCHYDGNRGNNHLSNLRWGTPTENTQDSIRHGTHMSRRSGEEKNVTKLTRQQVRGIRAAYIPGKFGYIRVAAKYGISMGAVRNIIKRRTWAWLSD